MTRRLAAATAVVAAAATAATLGTSGSPSTAGAQQTSPRTFSLASPFGSGHSARLETGRRGFSPGDEFFTTGAKLVDPASGRRVGATDGMEVVVGRAGQGTVALTGTLRLADGRIHMQGLIRHSDRRQQLPVVGGTGAYEGASGTVTVREDVRAKRNIMEVRLLP
jgi:Dirigent-like protein